MSLYKQSARLLEGIRRRATTNNYKISFSQCGEDLIVDFVLRETLHIKQPSYLDIGAYHPSLLSNTYHFYKLGGRGVCVEPDPILCAAIKQTRPRDICLNAGVGLTATDTADFYVMSVGTLNTFSRQEAERYQSYGTSKIEKVIPVPLLTVNQIIKKHFDSAPNFVSIDVEGWDAQIVSTFDFSRFRPQLFCIETLTYTSDKSEKKIDEIIDLMLAKDYFVFADTYINTIFVDKSSWRDR